MNPQDSLLSHPGSLLRRLGGSLFSTSLATALVFSMTPAGLKADCGSGTCGSGDTFSVSAHITGTSTGSTSVTPFFLVDHTDIKEGTPVTSGPIEFDWGGVEYKLGEVHDISMGIESHAPIGYASNGTTLVADLSVENGCGIVIQMSDDGSEGSWIESSKVESAALTENHPEKTCFFRLIKKAPEDEGGAGSAVAAAGQASSATISNATWNQETTGLPTGLVPVTYSALVSLGATPESKGYDTGFLSLAGPISASLANVANLKVRDPNVNALHQVYASGNIRQVTNLHRLADVITLSGGGFEIRMYDTGTFGTTLVSGLYPINSGATPYQVSKYTPVSAGSGHYGGIHVEVTGANGLTQSKDILATSVDGIAWRSVSSDETVDHESFFVFDGDTDQWERTDTTTVTRDSVLYSKNQSTYIYQYHLDGTAPVDRHLFKIKNKEFYDATNALTTTWEPDGTFLGKAASVAKPDGSWEAYTYYDGTESGADLSWRGRVKQTFRPWSGSVATAPTATPSTATASNAECTTLTYEITSGTAGFGRSPGIKTRITTLPLSGSPVTTAKSDLATSPVDVEDLLDLLSGAGVSADWIPDAGTLRETSTKQAASSSEWILSHSWVYDTVDVADSPWVGSTFANLDSTGSGTVTGYERGTYNSSTGAFTANDPADPPSSWGSDVKKTEVKVVDFGAPVAYEATRTVTIRDYRGNTLRREFSIKDDSAWNLATTTTWEYPQFWPDGSPKETVEKQDGRIVSHETWASATEVGSSDEQGITTTTVTDDHGRTVSTTRGGVSAGTGYEAQADQVTTYAYAGRTATITVTAGSLSQSSYTTTDLAGRTLSETDFYGITRTMAYSDGGRTVTTTGPGDLDTVQTTSVDTQASSQTGRAVVDSITDVEVLSSGNLLTTTRTGDVTDSPRYSATETDWAGRTVSTRAPLQEGYGETSYPTTYQTGTTRANSRTSVAGILLLEHSISGSSLRRSGYSLTSSSSLNDSVDAVIDTLTSYALEGGLWWEVATIRQYDVDGSSASALVATTKRCLNGVPGSGLSAKSIRIEPSGATYTTITELDRSTHTQTTSTTWNGSSNPEVKVNVNGLVISQLGREGGSPTKWTYDGFGRQLTETSPRGAVNRTTYGGNGQVASTIDPYNQTTIYDYYGPSSKSAGQVAKITHPGGTTTTYAYDDLGHLLETAGTAEYRVTYKYDDYGVKNKMSTYRSGTTPDTTEWVYEAGTGLLLEKKYADGNKTTFVYDYSTNLLSQRKWARTVSGVNVTTSYGYYPNNGFLDRVYVATHSDSGITDTTGIDRLGRTVYQLAITGPGDYRGEWLGYHPGTGAPDYRYHLGTSASDTLLGIGIRWPDVDSAGRPTGYSETSNFNTAVERTVSYSYDAAGRLDTITDGNQTHTYNYASGSSQVTSLESKDSGTTWFKELRNLDSYGRLIGIQSNRITPTVTNRISTYAYSYDALGRRTKATLQDGSSWAYGYNDRSEVTSATRNDTAGSSIDPLGATYAYDGIGNRTASNSDVLGNHTYTANNLNQYDTITTGNSRTAAGRAPAYPSVPTTWPVDITVGTSTYTPSRSGEFYYKTLTASNSSAPVWQTVVTTATNPAPTPAVTVSSTNHLWYAKASFTPAYDLDGNLTDDGRWTYTWDAKNQLIQMESTSAAVTASHPYTKLVFKYDSDGRRIERAVWQGGTSGSPTFQSRRRWLYDGWNPIAEFESNASGSTNTRLNTFTWGLDLSGGLTRAGGVGGLIAQTTVRGGVVRRASYDGNGNIVSWTRDDQSSAECRLEYDSFGNMLISEGALPSDYGFSTKLRDAPTGLIYYGYRYYNSTEGRWLTRDPLGEQGGRNLYSMVGNKTPNFVDYLGMEDYPCNCDADLGRFKNLTFKLSSSFYSGNVYTFTDPGTTVLNFLKKKAQKASIKPPQTSDAADSVEQALDKANKVIQGGVKTAKKAEQVFGLIEDAAMGFNIMEIVMDVGFDLCKKNKEGKYVWAKEGATGDSGALHGLTFKNNPDEVAGTYKDVMVEAASQVADRIREAQTAK